MAERAGVRPIADRQPWVILVLAVVALAWVVGPVAALSIRAPWAELPRIAALPESRQMLAVTVYSSLWSSAITVLIGSALALVIAGLPRGRSNIARAFVLLPLAMPPVVAGLALTALVGTRGIAAPLLDALGVQLAFRFPGVVAAHVFVSLPFVVVAIESALGQMDREVTESARAIGMSRWQVLVRVVVPALAPALATGAGLAMARSLGEFGTTLTFAGSLPGVTRTMPLGIYLARDIDQDQAYGLSALLILLALVTLVLALAPQLFSGRSRRSGESRASLGPDPEALVAALLESAPAHDPDTTPLGAAVRGSSTANFSPGRVTAIIGPNGAGKTTLTRALAGLHRVDGLEVSSPGRTIMLTQRHGLPPRSTVLGAVTMATGDRDRARVLLDAAHMSPLASCPVSQLSAGQAAQVALVRAVAARPSTLILDEPFAAIDVEASARWRRALRTLSRRMKTAVVLVTHDAVDVATIADSIVVVDSLRVVAQADTEEVLAAPPTAFSAELLGVNRLEGEVVDVDADTVTLSCRPTDSSKELLVVGVPDPDAERPEMAIGDRGVAIVDPRAITIERTPSKEHSLSRDDARATSARNRWAGRVTEVAGGRSIDLVVDVAGHPLRVPVTAASAKELGLDVGTPVRCTAKALSVRVYRM